MTISEKIDNSANHTRFTLYKEGLFYKCHNEDAMVFVKNIREYKVSKNFVKSVGEDVYSIGFPVSEIKKGSLSLANILEKIGAKSFEESGDDVIFILDNAEVKSNYNIWIDTLKQEMPVAMVKEPESPYMSIDVLGSITDMIKDFDLANSTPMQGLNFIQQLKSVLNNRDKNNGNI